VPRQPCAVLLNALHTSGGGGLTYLAGLLPHLVSDERYRFHLLAPQATLDSLAIPDRVVTHIAPDLRFGVAHLWEQLVLPVKATSWGCRAIVSNANYGPVVGPWPFRPSAVIIHSTRRAAASRKGLYQRLYWTTLSLLTRTCLWCGPVHFAVADHVVADYASGYTARKVLTAHPALDVAVLPRDVERESDLVLAVGDFYAQKNYPLLVQAFAKLHRARPEARLLLIGRPVVPAVRDEVVRMAGQLGVAEALTLVPGVPHAELMKAMGQATVYFNTSSAEAFNLPVLEALASGTPCVLPDTPFQREVAGDAAVFVQPGREDAADAFAMALLEVLTRPSTARSFARRGLARAAEFSWPRTAKVIGDGLAGVLGVNSRSAREG